MTEYNDMKTLLATMNKRQEGGLLSQDLTEVFILNKIDQKIIVDSHYLATLMAIVPK